MFVVRLAQMAAVVLLAGAFAFAFLVLPPAARQNERAASDQLDRWLGRCCAWALPLALVSWLFWLAFVAERMSGKAPDYDVLATVLSRTTFGQLWSLRFGLMLLLAVQIFLSYRPARAHSPWVRVAGAGLALVVLMSLPWAGHTVGTQQPLRVIHLTADAAHLLGAGLWLGALAPLLFVLHAARRSDSPDWHALAAIATQRFSALGVFAVATLLISGFLNAYFLVGSFEALANTTYGRLVALKVGFFVVIVSIAAVNRLKLRPRLSLDRDWGDTAKDALSTLRRNVIAELCLGAAILAAVAGLGITPPSVHRHDQVDHPGDHLHHK